MRKTLLCICSIFLGIIMSIQAQQLDWYHQSGSSAGDSNAFLERDDQGNIYHIVNFYDALTVAGVSLNPPANTFNHFYLAKYDSLGNVGFVQPFYRTTNTDFCCSE